MLKRTVKEFIKHTVARAGLQIRSLGPDSMRGALQELKRAGLSPKVVLDVGVHAVGTPELYSAFPDAKFLLVEPAAEFAPAIKKFTSSLKDAELIIAAASDRVSTGTLRITRNSYVHTSLADESHSSEKGGAPVDFVEVPIVTMDSVCQERGLAGPYLLKVDVDGVDLDVLKGSTEILKNTDVVIVEAPVHALLERAQFLAGQGMSLWGMVDPIYFDQKLWQVDLIFISDRLKDDPRFRPWSAPGFRFA